MRNRKPGFKLLSLFAAIAILSVASAMNAQGTDADRPWMNPKLSPEDRAELVLKQLTLDEKIALLHGNGMAHDPNSAHAAHAICQRGRRIR